MERITIEKTAAEVAVLAAKALSDLTGTIANFRSRAEDYAKMHDKGHWYADYATEATMTANVLQEALDLWLAKNKMADLFQPRTFNFTYEKEEVNNG
jgi:hypothetical protein